MDLKLGLNGIFQSGFNGGRGIVYADQGNLFFGELGANEKKIREKIAAQAKIKSLQNKSEKEYREQKRQLEKIKKQRQLEKLKKQKKIKTKKINSIKSKKFLKAAKENNLGYDFGTFLGSPLEGFSSDDTYINGLNLVGEGLNENIEGVDTWDNTLGLSIKMPKVKIQAPKIQAPKIAPPKVTIPKKIELPKKVALPKVSVPKVSVPKVTVPKDFKKAVANVVAAPTAALAHTVKQAGGHKLESGVKAATGVSITKLAKGGPATISEGANVAGKVITAPVALTDKAIKQVGGHKLVNALDRVSGGTYSQAVSVGTLPGRALAGQAITKKDWVEVASLSMKVGAVIAAGGAVGYAVELGKKYAAKELATKLGGNAGMILSTFEAATSGDIVGALQTKAQEEAQKTALAEATKKLGPNAAGILSIGSAIYAGDTGKAATIVKDTAKERALLEVSKKTGVPMNLVSAVEKGEVPSPSQMKQAMQKELMQAPDKLQSELAKIPELMKNAPEAAKKTLIQKQELLKSELANRDKKVAELINKHSEELKKSDEKIKAALEKTDLQKSVSDRASKAAIEAQNEYDKAKKDPKSTAERLKQLEAKKDDAIKVQNVEAEKLAQADSETAVLVAQKEEMDSVYQAKEYSASNGLYGVRTSENGTVLAEYQETLPQSVVDKSLVDHPFITAGLIPRKKAGRG